MKQPKEQPVSPKYKVFEHQGQEFVYERRVVHDFVMGDCEDPDLYIATPIYEWQQTELGKWVMEHGKDPTYHIFADPVTFGYKVRITAYVTPKRWTEYCLRFS